MIGYTTRIMVNKGISFWLSTHYPYFSAGNDTQNTLIFWPMNTQIPLCCSHNWILKRQRVKVKSTNSSFQPKRHWKAHVSWWKYSIVTERKHYFAKRIENCLPINGNSEKNHLSTRPTPKSAHYPYSTSMFEYSNNTLKSQHRVLDTLICFQVEYSIPLL